MSTAAATPARRPPRWLPRTLVARLVSGVVAVIIVVVTLTGALTALLLESFLRERLDQQLLSTATDTQVNALLQAGSSAPAVALSAPQRVYVAVLDRQGNALTLPSSSNNLEPLKLSATQRSVLNAVATGPRSMTDEQGARIRLLTLPDKELHVGAAVISPVTVVVGLSEHEVGVTMQRVLLLEVAIGGGAVVLALAVTATGVRWSLRPLRRVTRTAQEVTAELSPEGAGLQRRVLDADPQTEVGLLAASFNTMLDQVQLQFGARRDSENRMRQFLADASHELRTPLTSIRGYAELARLSRTADTADALGRIEAEGTRMSRLVDDLLLLARGEDVDAGEAVLIRERVDMADLVQEAVAGARAAYQDRPIQADVGRGLLVLGDADQLLRVIRNLLTNAAVHTAPGGPILIQAQRAGADIVVTVRDSGPGIAPEEVAHVFQRFWRADKARSRARGGSGLGLAIVAHIVAAHGGDASFVSAPATGSTVTIRLPAA